MKEYGGYLSLELKRGREYYQLDETKQLRVNNGRSAIICAIEDGKYKKIYIPLYTCHSVLEALEKRKIKYEIYNIDSDFEPIDVKLKKDELLLWTNYFGIASQEKIKRIVSKYGNVLVDNTQAFFAEPVMEAYNVYSCRKFFGVSDGAYLIHANITPMALEKDVSWKSASYLFEAIEEGTNHAYQHSLENEKRIEESGIRAMSVLTKHILMSIDYEEVISRRKHNFDFLHRELRMVNQLNISNFDCIPMVYPLLIENKDLREKLIKKRIYVPQWWKWVAENDKANEFERKLSNYLLPLPIDQRYDGNDLKFVSDVILQNMQRN